MSILAVCFTSCQKESEQYKAPVDENGQRQANVRLSSLDPTKAHMDDALGLIWDESDEITWFYYHSGDENAYWSTPYTLQAADITAPGYEAVYRGNLDAGNLWGVFRYNVNGNNEVYFANANAGFGTLSSGIYSFSQTEAGVMNKKQIHLHSGLNCVDLDNTADGDEQAVGMDIMGTVFRIIPFTNSYNTETISSVSILSYDNIIGTVRYHYGSNVYYDSVNDANYWSAKGVTVNLETGMSLSGVTSRENSKAIYFSLPATEAGVSTILGYTYIITTDAAVYYFDSAKQLVVENNKVKNVYLNMDKATRAPSGATTGTFWFDGNLAGSYGGNSLNYSAAGVTDDDSQYWLAYTNVGGAVNAMYPGSYPEFYSKTQIVILDSEGNTPDWITCAWKPSPDPHFIRMNVAANTTSDVRTATITFLPPRHVLTYDLRDNEPVKRITVTQAGLATVAPIISSLSSTSSPKGGSVVTARIDLQINGVDATEDQFSSYINEVELTATNAKMVRSGHTLTLYIGVNPTAASRDITITATHESDVDTAVITQAANDAAIPQTFSYGFSAWQGGFDASGMTLNFNIAEEDRGDWLAVLTGISKNGTPYGGDVPDEDKEDLLKYVFQLDDAGFAAAQEWLTFGVTGGAGECFIKILHKNANTGPRRSVSLYIYNSDLEKVRTVITINQDPA